MSFPQRHVDLDSDGLLGRQRWQEQPLLSDTDGSDTDDARTALVYSGRMADNRGVGNGLANGNGAPGTGNGMVGMFGRLDG